MIKKLFIAAVALVALGTVYAVDPGGHVSTVASYFQGWFKPSLDYQIRRAEQLVGRLDDSIHESQEFLAREKVELGKLEDNVKRDRVAVERKRERVVALRGRFGQGEQLVSTGPGKRNELARELSQLKIMDRKYETSNKILGVRKERYEALANKLQEMLTSKETMKLKLEEMKSDLEAVRLGEAQSRQYSMDDGDFKAASELLEQIDTEVKTRRELADMRRATEETPEVSAEENANVVDEVDAYLSASR